MAAELAATYVSLVPSFQGGSAAISRLLDKPAAAAGQSSGKKFGSGFLVAAAAGVAAAGVAVSAALVSALDVGAANDKLAAQLGLTESESARIGGVAGRLYADAYGESISDVNGAVRSVIQNIDGMRTASSAAIEETSARAIDLASAFDEDVSGAARAAGVILKNGLAPDAEAAFDVLTRGFQVGANASDDLLDTFTEYPALFSRLGLDAETSLGLLSQGLEGGARNTDLVADALKEFQIRSTDASKLSAEEMTAQIAAGGTGASEGLQLVLDKLRDTEDPVARNAAAVALFGTQAEDLGEALFSLDPSAAVSALGQVSGASDQLGETLNDNAKTNLTAFWRQAKGVLVDFLGGQVVPAVNKVALFLSDNLGPALSLVSGIVTGVVIPGLVNFSGWLEDNWGWLGPIAAGLGGIALALGVYKVVVVAATAATVILTTAQAGLNAVMRLNPALKIVALLSGLVAAIVYAYKTSETFRNIVTGVWRSVSTAATVSWGIIKAFAIDPLVAGFGWVKNRAGDMKDFVLRVFSGIASGVRLVFSGAIRGIKSAINSVTGVINKWLISPLNSVLGVFDISIPSMPTLHSGGMVPGQGEKPYILLGGEAVLNPQATRALGPEAIEALNSGRGFGGWGDAIDFGASIVRAATSPNDLAREVAEAHGEVTDYVRRLIDDKGSQVKGFIDKPFVVDAPIDRSVDKMGDAILGVLGAKERDYIASGTQGAYSFPLPPGTFRVGVGLGGYPGHTGQDFPAPIGTPVFSPISGFVTKTDLGDRSYGKYASVTGGGLRFIGAHLSSFAGRNGLISAGDLIGRVGSTGNSTGPHLHAEFRRNGAILDPREILRFDSGRGVLPTGHSLVYNGTGGPEPLVDPRRFSTSAADVADMMDGVEMTLVVDGDPIRGVIRSQISGRDRAVKRAVRSGASRTGPWM